MPRARVAFWELRRHNVAEEAVRGGVRTRIHDRAWPLPEAVRERLRPVLEPLGFDLARAVTVREPDGADALEFSQDDARG